MKEKFKEAENLEAVHTHTHTHTLGSVKEKNRKIWNKNQSELARGNQIATAGITLVALVVTIVVLLILAGITISYVMGDNSVFKKASEAKLQTDIAQWKERLELAKGPVFIEGLGTFDADKYFDYIKEQGIINNRETDVVDNEDGTYDVTTKPGYIFEVALIPSPEKPTDAEITYIGQAGKILPIIKKLEVSATSTSITGKAIVSRLGNGTIKYYYKLKTENDSEYKEITNINAETGATQSSGIVAGTEYVIKVAAKNDVGEVEKTEEITATKVFVESIILNKTTETVAVGKTVTLMATVKPDDATNKNVTWESSNAAVATVSDTGIITGKTAGTITITVKATDGSDKTASCTVTVKSVSLNKKTEIVPIGGTKTLVATVLPVDALNKNVTWSSSNTSIATVNNSGVVTGKTEGTVIITVSTTDASKATASCTITVKKPTVADIVGVTQTANKTTEDEYGNKIVIPGGFKVVPNGTSDVTYTYSGDGSPNVQDGIVIEDNEGNQFVWIPVGNIKNKNGTTTTITLGRYTFGNDGTSFLKQDAINYSQVVTINDHYQELINDAENVAAKNLGTFVGKTNSNKGYYLGRYEASQGSDGKADSKANKLPWVSITQPNAATAARGMYSSNYVESDLINSYSWDTAIVFIQKYSGNSNYSNKAALNSSLANTGKAGDKVCNIYDMASNCYEWSTEHSNETTSGNPCVARGGSYFYAVISSNRRMSYTTYTPSDGSFRVVCYVK